MATFNAVALYSLAIVGLIYIGNKIFSFLRLLLSIFVLRGKSVRVTKALYSSYLR